MLFHCFLPFLGVLLATGSLAGQSAGKAEYVGGTIPDVHRWAPGHILTTDNDYLAFQSSKFRVKILYERVNLLEYGQQVSRRYVLAMVLSPMLLVAKKRAHFLTVGFSDDEGRQQAMVFRVDKNDIRALLASLEARTGQKVTFQDTEARKAGRS